MMKKRAILSIALAILPMLICGCANVRGVEHKSGEYVREYTEAGYTMITVTYYDCGGVTEYTLRGAKISQLQSWLDGLVLSPCAFEYGESPADKDGGDAYSIGMYMDGELDGTVTYFPEGEGDGYLRIDDAGAWYHVENPSLPPV